MGVTIYVQINPALSGWLVELYYLYKSEWFFFYDDTTNYKGKVTLSAAASSYPVSLKVRVPAQTMGGIYYNEKEYTNSYDNGDVDYVTFNMEGAVHTTITIEAPATVELDETFSVTGILYETETGTPITNQVISLSYNGVTIGEALTGIDGDYLMQAMIPTSGSYTIKASFTGTTTLEASEAIRRVSTGVTSPIQAMITILGSAITGIALILYGLRR